MGPSGYYDRSRAWKVQIIELPTLSTRLPCEMHITIQFLLRFNLGATRSLRAARVSERIPVGPNIKTDGDPLRHGRGSVRCISTWGCDSMRSRGQPFFFSNSFINEMRVLTASSETAL
jgi:hypothetical protein